MNPMWLVIVVGILFIAMGVPVLTTLFLGILAYYAIKFYQKHELEDRKRREAEEAARAEAARKEAEAKRQHALEQEHLRVSLEGDRSTAVTVYSRIPTHLLNAEEMLDQAEREFSEGAFSPFWEAIEGTLRKLADVEGDVSRLGWLATSHAGNSEGYEGAIPPFPVDVEAVSRLQVADATEQRMRAVVRAAQKDFQFATIFEQRRTTSVLIAGFTTLAEAIDGLGRQLVSSLDSLSDQVRELEHGMRERQVEVLSAMQEIAEGIGEAAKGAAEQHQAEVAQREALADTNFEFAEKQLAILDNIQRHRRPLESERGPRKI